MCQVAVQNRLSWTSPCSGNYGEAKSSVNTELMQLCLVQRGPVGWRNLLGTDWNPVTNRWSFSFLYKFVQVLAQVCAAAVTQWTAWCICQVSQPVNIFSILRLEKNLLNTCLGHLEWSGKIAELSFSWQGSSTGAEWFVLSDCLLLILRKLTLLGILKALRMNIAWDFESSYAVDYAIPFFCS